MQDARYFRDQAALALEIARQMSDPALPKTCGPMPRGFLPKP